MKKYCIQYQLTEVKPENVLGGFIQQLQQRGATDIRIAPMDENSNCSAMPSVITAPPIISRAPTRLAGASRSTLRVSAAAKRQMALNKIGKPNKAFPNLTSKYTGVFKMGSGNWGCRLGFEGKSRQLGGFTSERDAVEAWNGQLVRFYGDSPDVQAKKQVWNGPTTLEHTQEPPPAQ